jgi:hypothetical protein
MKTVSLVALVGIAGLTACSQGSTTAAVPTTSAVASSPSPTAVSPTPSPSTDWLTRTCTTVLQVRKVMLQWLSGSYPVNTFKDIKTLQTTWRLQAETLVVDSAGLKQQGSAATPLVTNLARDLVTAEHSLNPGSFTLSGVNNAVSKAAHDYSALIKSTDFTCPA